MWLDAIEFTLYCTAYFIVLGSIFTPSQEKLVIYNSAAIWIVMLWIILDGRLRFFDIRPSSKGKYSVVIIIIKSFSTPARTWQGTQTL
jgi:hypothetical protein